MRHHFFSTAVTAILVAGAAHADSVGSAILSEKSVQIAAGSADPTPLAVGGDIVFGAKIITGFDAGNVDEFLDGTRITVASDSQITIDKYVYNASTGVGEMAVQVTTGAMRFISGRIASDQYEIRTPNAYLGIRGTTFVLSYSPSTGTIVVVEEGEVELTNLGGANVDVAAGQFSAVAANNTAPTPPAPPAAAANAAVANVNTSVAISAPAAVGVPNASTQIAAQAAAAASAAANSPADNSTASFGGDGKY